MGIFNKRLKELNETFDLDFDYESIVNAEFAEWDQKFNQLYRQNEIIIPKWSAPNIKTKFRYNANGRLIKNE